MQKARLTALLLLSTCLSFPNGAWSQSPGQKALQPQRALLLTPASNGQSLYASVGQLIEVDLQTLQTAGYEAPQVSTPNVQYRNSVLLWPPNPGGPLPIYIFEAVSPGAARIQFPRNGGPGFDVTLEVRPASGKASSSVSLDQANTVAWREGWTTLVNPLRQKFIPSLPKLNSIEVELVVGNPGPTQGVVTLMLENADGQGVLEAEKTVAADDCAHVRFLLPAGVAVSAGKTYSIQLSDDGQGLFGWKYVAGGYDRGDASFSGKPLLNDGRGRFLFRTFGMK